MSRPIASPNSVPMSIAAATRSSNAAVAIFR
jgi:hypothetical protein